jgi:hypothetical protein
MNSVALFLIRKLQMWLLEKNRDKDSEKRRETKTEIQRMKKIT